MPLILCVHICLFVWSFARTRGNKHSDLLRVFVLNLHPNTDTGTSINVPGGVQCNLESDNYSGSFLLDKTRHYVCLYIMCLYAASDPQVERCLLFQSGGWKLPVTVLLPSGLWNGLPEEIRLTESVTSLKSHLEKLLFMDLLSCDTVFLLWFYHFLFTFYFTCSLIFIVIWLL